MNLSTFFKSRFKTYRVILRSGNEFRISASDVKISFNSVSNQITKYEFVEPKGEVPFHCSPLEIVAIVRVKA